ncbi:uncharacterized protein LOC126841489 [Adelges cooleyi]|uniref:uncharacterized protein LOC126841489 n=1 Tax=Adelges cooleyi TaxID=133065 RepID=UPI00217F3B04|nr:uncharacterized protein LOC126841489 [Adelges cooleyi]
MKHFCFLISLFFVNILANDLSDYKESVYNINDLIRRAHYKNDVTVGDRSGANGLEHIIELMIDDDHIYKDFRKINCLIAVPERPKMIRKVLGPHSNILKNATFFHEKMLTEMASILGIQLYGVRYQFWGKLKTLGDNRRELVVPALKQIILRVLDGGPSVLRVCRLMGLYLSTQFPNSYIKKIQIDPTDGTCILGDRKNTNWRYGKIDEEWSQISLEDINVPVQSVKEQLQLGFPQVLHSSDESENSLEEDNNYYASRSSIWPFHRG